jgi:hypothetical protein
MIATGMNHEARQVRASVDGPIRRVNRNRAGLIILVGFDPEVT